MTMPSGIDCKAPTVALPILLIARWYSLSIAFVLSPRHVSCWGVRRGSLNNGCLQTPCRGRRDPMLVDQPSEPRLGLLGPVDTPAPDFRRGGRGAQPDCQPPCGFVCEENLLVLHPDSSSPLPPAPRKRQRLRFACLETNGAVFCSAQVSLGAPLQFRHQIQHVILSTTHGPSFLSTSWMRTKCVTFSW